MKKENKDAKAETQTTDLRKRAEEIASKKTTKFPAELKVMSPEETQQTLHELRVHQIELEMQNEELRRVQAELERVRARYSDLYDLAPVAYLILSKNGMIQEANLTSANLLDVERSVLVKHSLSRFILSADHDIYYCLRELIFKTALPQVCELRMMRQSGMPFWAHLEATASLDADGATVCRIVMSDISDQKKTKSQREVALDERRESENFLETLLNSIPIPVFYKDRDGRYVGFNKAFETFFGATKEKLIGKTVFDINPPDLAAIYHARDSELFASGGIQQYESQVKTTIGMREVIFNKAIYTGRHGKISGQIGVIQDITERKRAENVLRESEERFRLLAQNSNDIIQIMDRNGVPSYISDQLSRILGYRPEERIGRSSLSDIHPDDFLAVQDVLCAIIEHPGTTGKIEYRYRHKNGHWVDLEGIGCSMLGDPAIHGIFLNIRDITARKQAEDALRNSEEKHRLLIENSHDIIYTLATDGVFTFVSPAWTVLLGHLVTQVEGQSFQKFVHLDDIPRCLVWLQKVIETGQRQEGIEYRVRHLNGAWYWHTSSAVPLRDETGKVIGFEGTARDITERKLVENKLSEAQELTKTIVESTSDMIWSVDPESFGLLSFNQSLSDYILQHTGVSIKIGMRPEDMFSTDDYITKWHEYYNRALTEGSYSTENRSPVGVRNLLLNFNVLRKNDAVFGISAFGKDITAHRQAEEEKRDLEERLSRAEKMESLGLLAGGVAHDLNNVLGIVVGYAELVLDAVDEKSPLRKDLTTIFDGGQKAAAIVDDLLTLARRGVVGKKVLNLNKLISDFKKSPQWEKLLAYHPSVQIKTDLDPDLLNISASSIHLEKTLYNLISNACEALTKGGTLTIKTANQYIDKPIHGYDTIHEGDYVVLSVSDEGDGISETDIKRIFEPFYTKKIMGRSGTGLGLSVVWGTVKDHQGYIDVQSEEGKGTTFTLYFLITREDTVDEDITVSMSEYLGNGQTILIVDDVKDQRDLAARLLTSLNYKVSSVESGEEAIKYLKDHQLDLIVLDMIMDPGMDGLDTYKSILEINPKQKAIIVSGFSESDRVKEAKTLGAGAYIKKPYIKEKLGMEVKKELARK